MSRNDGHRCCFSFTIEFCKPRKNCAHIFMAVVTTNLRLGMIHQAARVGEDRPAVCTDISSDSFIFFQMFAILFQLVLYKEMSHGSFGDKSRSRAHTHAHTHTHTYRHTHTQHTPGTGESVAKTYISEGMRSRTGATTDATVQKILRRNALIRLVRWRHYARFIHIKLMAGRRPRMIGRLASLCRVLRQTRFRVRDDVLTAIPPFDNNISRVVTETFCLGKRVDQRARTDRTQPLVQRAIQKITTEFG